MSKQYGGPASSRNYFVWCFVVWVALLVGVVLVAFGGVAMELYANHARGSCIANRPLVVTGGTGAIRGEGTFRSGVMVWSLSYAGTYEHTGESCKAWRTVTESEYARHMYRSQPTSD